MATPKEEPNHVAKKLLSGAIAGAGATAAIYPIDTIADIQKTFYNSPKNKAQAAAGESFFAAAKHLVKTKGIRKGLYKGILPKIMKVAPSMALTFLIQDAVQKQFEKKAVATSTHPIARTLYGLVPAHHLYDEAFIGRMNTNKGMFPHERELATKLETTPDDNPHSYARFLTNPLTAATAITGTNVLKSLATKKWYNAAGKYIQENIANPERQRVVHELQSTIGMHRPDFPIRFKNISTMGMEEMAVKGVKAGLLAGAIALGARAIYPRAMEGTALKERQDWEKGVPSAYIRKKLREDAFSKEAGEIPVQYLDDAAILAMRILKANPELTLDKKKENVKLAGLPIAALDDIAVQGLRALKAKQPKQPKEQSL